MKQRIIELPSEIKSGPVMLLRALCCCLCGESHTIGRGFPACNQGMTDNKRSLGLRPQHNTQGSQSKEWYTISVSHSLLQREARAVAAAHVIRQAARREERRSARGAHKVCNKVSTPLVTKCGFTHSVSAS